MRFSGLVSSTQCVDQFGVRAVEAAPEVDLDGMASAVSKALSGMAADKMGLATKALCTVIGEPRLVAHDSHAHSSLD